MLAVAWVTLGLLWGGFHFAIVPRIGELRPWLEQQASQRLGATVQIGALEARSNGLIPSVELRDVRILDASGHPALWLPKVMAGLSPRSLMGAAFEQLYLEGPELEVRRTADGRIWIGGLPLSGQSGASSPGLDWLFAQKELAVRHGQVRWVDELRGVAPLELQNLDLVIRNRGRAHSMRLDADPPAGWGARLTVMGQFLHPLFGVHHGDWRTWHGTLYGESAALDLASLKAYADLGVELQQGNGGVRLWADLDHGKVVGATADLALQSVVARLSSQLELLGLHRVLGRLTATLSDAVADWSTENLAFETNDGLRWPGGKWHLRLPRGDAAAKPDATGGLSADQIDLAVLADVAQRLPLPDEWHAQISSLAPHGQLEKLQYSWVGPVAQPRSYAVSGRVAQLAWVAQAARSGAVSDSLPLAGLPGIRSAALDFSLTQSDGHAHLSMDDGALAFPGIFERPEFLVGQLAADVNWKIDSRRISVDVNNLRFHNADLQGEARLKWQTAELPHGAPASLRFPGVLDLQGSLSRADVAAVARYLPMTLDHATRDYLQQALLAGNASNVRFRVRGDLARFPFADARQGDFRITADLQNTSFAYAPAGTPAGAPGHDGLVWPTLTQVQGALVLDHDLLQINGARGLAMPGTGLWFARTDASVSKLFSDPQLLLTAEARGALSEALELLNRTPLGTLSGKALAHAQGVGMADYKFRLLLPLERPEKASVQGSVALSNNEFQFAPELPRLTRVRGVVAFTEGGVSMAGLQARALGGDVRMDGGLIVGTGPQPSGRLAPASTLRLQGVMTAEGLRQATELGWPARLGSYLAGSTPYSLGLTLRAGAPELSLSSSLVGLEVNLPAPLHKSAETSQTLRLENAPQRAGAGASLRLRDTWRLELGTLASVLYVRDLSGPEPRVLRGSMALGLAADEISPLPPSGVTANLHLDQLDVDAWLAVFNQLGGPANLPGHVDAPAKAGASNAAAASTTAATTTAATTAAATASNALQSYLPNQLALRANSVVLQGRKLNHLLIGASRDDTLWRVNVDANEVNGYVEYRQPHEATPGRLYARLAHLVIGQSAEQDMETLLDQQPASIPALDVVVDDLELRGKKMGRVEIQAVNPSAANAGSGREGPGEWQLNRFNISTPEASLTASGNWAPVVSANAGTAPNATEAGAHGRRRTALKFKLDISDSGGLLNRMGMPGVLAKGHGTIEGQVGWLGTPFSPDYPSMSGGFHADVETGQFLKADPGIAKLFGVLSLQSLPRRLVLDFRDVFSEGFAFDFVRGDVTVAEGIARTNNLQMKGVNAAVLMEGQADIARETQLLKVVVIPEINAGSASLLASAINPVVGITTFLAQVILRRPLIEANTQEFQVDGTWLDPRVTRLPRPQ